MSVYWSINVRWRVTNCFFLCKLSCSVIIWNMNLKLKIISWNGIHVYYCIGMSFAVWIRYKIILFNIIHISMHLLLWMNVMFFMFYLYRLLRNVRTGKSEKKNQNENMSPSGLEPATFYASSLRLKPLSDANIWRPVFKCLVQFLHMNKTHMWQTKPLTMQNIKWCAFVIHHMLDSKKHYPSDLNGGVVLQTFPLADLPPRKVCNIAGLQHCRSTPFHCRSSPGEDLQHCRPSTIFVNFRIIIFGCTEKHFDYYIKKISFVQIPVCDN